MCTSCLQYYSIPYVHIMSTILLNAICAYNVYNTFNQFRSNCNQCAHNVYITFRSNSYHCAQYEYNSIWDSNQLKETQRDSKQLKVTQSHSRRPKETKNESKRLKATQSSSKRLKETLIVYNIVVKDFKRILNLVVFGNKDTPKW